MATSKKIKKAATTVSKPKRKVSNFGVSGLPINKTQPFYFGFVATLGVLTAIVLLRALESVSQIFVLILVSLFLATGLNPAVEALRKRNLSRGSAVAVIFSSVILFVVFFAFVVVPPVVNQGTTLIENAPQLLDDLMKNRTINSLNDQFGLIDTLQSRLNSVTSDGTLLISTFGGVIGVGQSILSGFFTALTILVLTLYFITSLPQAVSLGLSLVPASRRERVGKLTNAVIERVGLFVGSQILIAAMAGVFVVALIPLIGHFIGAGVVTLIALTQSPLIGLIAFVAYVLYVQIENYVLTPRIMKRTLSVPGAVTIISALIGSSLLGLVGGLLAVPVAASIILILDEVVIPRANKA